MIEQKTSASGNWYSFESIKNSECFKNERVNRIALIGFATIAIEYVLYATLGKTVTILLNLSIAAAIAYKVIKLETKDGHKDTQKDITKLNKPTEIHPMVMLKERVTNICKELLATIKATCDQSEIDSMKIFAKIQYNKDIRYEECIIDFTGKTQKSLPNLTDSDNLSEKTITPSNDQPTQIVSLSKDSNGISDKTHHLLSGLFNHISEDCINTTAITIFVLAKTKSDKMYDFSMIEKRAIGKNNLEYTLETGSSLLQKTINGREDYIHEIVFEQLGAKWSTQLDENGNFIASEK